jgi:hypothetical protein
LRTPLKLVVSGIGIALLAAILTVNGFAMFNAGATDPAEFAHGTLVLFDTVGNEKTTCFSTSCGRLFDLAVRKPGEAFSARVTLRNESSIDAATLRVFVPRCSSAVADGESRHGTGDICNSLRLSIQRWTSGTFTTPSACLYGAAAGTACTFDDAAKTLGAFAAAHPDSSTGVDLGDGLVAGAAAYLTIAQADPREGHRR